MLIGYGRVSTDDRHLDLQRGPLRAAGCEKVDLLASRLRMPLQIEQHLTLPLETGHQASEKPVGIDLSREIKEQMLAAGLPV